jgi:DNA-binding SARP family transcriptional activator
VLDPIDEGPYVDGWLFQSAVDVWYGFALLLEGDDAGALGRLRRAVDAMLASDGHIELPTAAAYLAEAEWRAGDEEAADRAADLGLRAARAQGSNHLLLLALGDFPAVVSRRIDAEPSLDSPWHELGRALVAQGVAVRARAASTVRVCELGGLEILVDGERVQPALTKSAELLAYLVERGAGPLDRDELLGALFDGRDDNSTRAYLRQALHHLRQALPEGAVVTERGSVGLGADVAVTSEAACLAAELAEAARLQGAERLDATLRALAARERGEYLPDVDAAWADARRDELSAVCLDARLAAAGVALELGRYAESRALGEEVVRADPFREAAWRLLMRIAIVHGDGDGAIAAYRRCQQALAEVGARPCPATHDLMRQLRAERDLASTDAALASSR